MSTAVALSHNMFDAALMLGICDKIVPGLMMGALRFGHLPTIFVPGGPMVSGISNKQKADVRQRYAEGKASREELLESEMNSYHSPGTCTFYGTANTNQLVMEVMGLHLPGASFVNPYTPLRDALTAEAAQQVTRMTKASGSFMPLGEIVDEKALVNSIVALHATGGSTNHTLHIPAIAQAAGIQLTWQDMADLSEVVPTLSHVYPNGKADINHFQAAGGMAFLIRELLDAGLLHEDVNTVAGHGLRRYTQEPFLDNGKLVWREGPQQSLDESILRPVARPFSAEGGLRVMEGNLGRGVMKVSAVAPEHQVVEAPARVFQDQQSLADAFKAGGWSVTLSPWCASRARVAMACRNCTNSRHSSVCCRTVATRWRWLQTGACPVPRARSRPSTFAPKRMTAARWRGCAMVISCESMVSKARCGSWYRPKNWPAATCRQPPRVTTWAAGANCSASCAWRSARQSRARVPSPRPWRTSNEGPAGWRHRRHQCPFCVVA